MLLTVVMVLLPGYCQSVTAVCQWGRGHVANSCYGTVARLLPGHEHSDQRVAAVRQWGRGLLAVDCCVRATAARLLQHQSCWCSCRPGWVEREWVLCVNWHPVQSLVSGEFGELVKEYIPSWRLAHFLVSGVFGELVKEDIPSWNPAQCLVLGVFSEGVEPQLTPSRMLGFRSV